MRISRGIERFGVTPVTARRFCRDTPGRLT